MAPTACGQSPPSALGPSGTVWGGEHVELETTVDGASLKFDCANGTIAKPVTLDEQGRFKVSGTFTREHGGPVMRDNPNLAAPAVYSGVISGDTLRMTITSGPQNQSLGAFMLARGRPGRVVKCK